MEESLKLYYVYIMTSPSRVLYIGMTDNLERRVSEHKQGLLKGFTSKYKCKILVYFESSNDVSAVLEREKQLKRWNRQKKIDLIEKMNPEWKDLGEELS
ncbi:MAG: GIY-YIG nuclease family protein [Patescibacteria group bacterium]